MAHRNLKSPFLGDLLSGKVVVVTGGSSGIGLEIAKQLGKHGAAIAMCGRRENVLTDACNALKELGITAFGASCDVRSSKGAEAFIAAVLEALGRIDVLVNCAAGNFLAPAEFLSVNGFKTVMEIDAVGTFNMSRAAFAALKASRGTVVNISATLHYGASWYQIHASAAKAAVDSITRTLGLEWGPEGIRAVGIAPGPIAGTPGMTKLAPGMEDMVKEMVPLRAMGEKWDIAMAVLFLVSGGAAYITGETLVVDGGTWLNTGLTPPIPKELVTKKSRGVEAKSRKVGTAARSKL